MIKRETQNIDTIITTVDTKKLQDGLLPKIK